MVFIVLGGNSLGKYWIASIDVGGECSFVGLMVDSLHPGGDKGFYILSIICHNGYILSF